APAGPPGRARLEASRVLPEAAREPAPLGRQRPGSDGQIPALDGAGLELPLKPLEGAPAPGEEEQPRGVPVEAVHDVKSRVADPPGALRIEQALDQALLVLPQLRRHAQE